MNFNKYRQSIISVILTLFLLIVGAVIYQHFKSQKKSTLSEEKVKEDIRNVKVASFTPQKRSTNISLDGRINAYEKISLGAEVTGKLEMTNKSFKKGMHFKKGTLLFKIYDQDDRYTLYSQRANLLTSISQIMPDLKFDYPQSFEKWKRYLDEFDVKKNVLTLPEITDNNEKYYIAGKNIQTQYYSIKSLEDKLNNYSIYAPFDGTFLTLNAYPGSLVSPGTPLATIMNTARYELEAPIATSDFQFVRPGQKVDLISEDFNTSWKGIVSRISDQIDQSTQNVPVFITVSGGSLRDGMYLSGTLKGNTLNDVIELPTSILIDQNKVFVLSDSVLVKKTIEILNREEESVLIRGIDATDKVVIEGVNNLFEGQKAQAINS